MKTKNKYLLVISLFVAILSVLLFKYYFDNDKAFYISKKIEQKVVDKNLELKSEINILFVGDIMTDRYIRKQINKYTKESILESEKEGAKIKKENDVIEKSKVENFVKNYLNNLSEINKNYDYVSANLEGPITENKSKTLNPDGTYGSDLIFTFPTSTTKILNLLNIKVVSLANNHTDNFYYAGYISTKNFLEKSNINYFGNPYNDSSKESLSKIICEKNICIAYIGYNKFTEKNDGKLIVDEIKRLKDNSLESGLIDFIVIMPHWGEEYDKTSNKNEVDIAHSWVDAGADLVVGAHPHVIQDSEVYKDKYIYYSLGNYIFDQWFTKDVQNGLGTDFTFRKECKEIKNQNENSENKKSACKKEIILNKELKIFIDRDGVRYN